MLQILQLLLHERFLEFSNWMIIFRMVNREWLHFVTESSKTLLAHVFNFPSFRKNPSYQFAIRMHCAHVHTDWLQKMTKWEQLLYIKRPRKSEYILPNWCKSCRALRENMSPWKELICTNCMVSKLCSVCCSRLKRKHTDKCFYCYNKNLVFKEATFQLDDNWSRLANASSSGDKQASGNSGSSLESPQTNAKNGRNVNPLKRVSTRFK